MRSWDVTDWVETQGYRFIEIPVVVRVPALRLRGGEGLVSVTVNT